MAKATEQPIDPEWLMLTIAELLPKNAIVVNEALTTAVGLAAFLPMRDRYAYFGNVSGGIGWGIAAAVGDADDIGEVSALLEQLDDEIISFIADGAYDGDPVNNMIRHQTWSYHHVHRQCRPAEPTRPAYPNDRGEGSHGLAENNRLCRRGQSVRRSALEQPAMPAWSIGSTLRPRSLAAQQGEVAIAIPALNRMIHVAKPLSVRIT